MRPPRDPDDTATLAKDGQIDPANVDAAQKTGRKRRDRPDPPQELRKWEKGADKRLFARPYPPNVMLEPAGFDEEHWTSPHADESLWTAQIADAFGTRSRAVMTTFMHQLEALCAKNIWDEEAQQWRLDENEFSSALAVINSLKPKNELEAAHAAQMVAIHILMMKVSARAIRYEYDMKTAATASRLARTFSMQREAFLRLRKQNRTTKQSFKVSRETHHHQHIHVHRGDNENDGQPHGRKSKTIDQRPTLPSPDETGNSVPLPGDEGEARLPHSRRQKPGCAQG